MRAGPARGLTGTLATAVEGGADVDAAWARYASPSRWPSWSPQLRAVDVAGGSDVQDRLLPGLRGTVRGPVPPALPFEVTAVDDVARAWSWTVHLGPVPLHLEHGVEPLPGRTGCRATLRMTGPWPLVLGYLPLARLALGRLVRP
ncbi:MAG: SRPBCC family protein [Motilibacteraceae bacterium]